MNPVIGASLTAPYRHWPLIVAAAVGPVLLGTTVSRELLAPAILVSVLLQVVVYGRILAQVRQGGTSAAWAIVREHGIDYLVASVLVGAVALVLSLGLSRLLPAQISDKVVVWIVQTVVAAVAIYVWPIVFLRRASIAAIPAGLTILARNLSGSWWIVGLVVTANVIRFAGRWVLVESGDGWSFAVLLFSGVAFIYLGAASFAGALHALVGNSDREA